MPVQVRYHTDPACVRSWSAEPFVRRLMVEFGDSVSWSWVMAGLARDYPRGHQPLVGEWLDAADEGGMPVDPRIWSESPIRSTYPACMAVKAAAEQSGDGGYRYLRVLREGLTCFRRKLDTTEALVEAAREARLNVERFRIDLESHAIVESFGADLEASRELGGGERVATPTAVLAGEDGSTRSVVGVRDYEELRRAAEAAGAEPAGTEPPAIADALRRFGRMATREVEVVCRLPGPRAEAELWRMATEWQVRPTRVLTGHLWELA